MLGLPRIPMMFSTTLTLACLAASGALINLQPQKSTSQKTTKQDDDSKTQEKFEIDLHGKTNLVLKAEFEQIEDSTYRLHERFKQLQDFSPAKSEAEYDTDSFREFLPSKAVSVGDTWKVDGDAVKPFLKQLHDGATLNLHHKFNRQDPVWACLRGVSEKDIEIVFRAHGEFVHEKGEDRRSTTWLTPSQFFGKLLIDRETGVVRFFELAVPPRNSNVDININGIVDIVYIPVIGVAGGDAGYQPSFTSEISIDDAKEKLAKHFYAFAKIDWVPFQDALEKAQEEEKPIHVVVLFGTLDDESC